MKKGIFYTHQGWTDITNTLSLISYYSNIYDELIVVFRDDSADIVNYYIKPLKNVTPYYVPKHILDSSMLNTPEQYDLLFHGYHDRFRNDKYKDIFSEAKMHFVRGFYELYDIPYIEKVNSFNLERDLDLENSEYEKFINKFGNDYIVFHDDQNSPGGKTGINLNDILEDKVNKINLSSITTNIFSYIKILQNAKEIHLTDSVWATVCYLIDSKYNLFQDKIVNLYAFKIRYGGLLNRYEDEILEPIHPKNWIIKHI